MKYLALQDITTIGGEVIYRGNTFHSDQIYDPSMATQVYENDNVNPQKQPRSQKSVDNVALIERKRRTTGKVADIIIPHHNRHDMLKECLESLDNDIFNIIIVSGGTFAENCNKGAKIATTDNLIFLNDDVIVREGVLEEMVKRKEDIVGVPLRIFSVNKVVVGMNMLWGKYGKSKILEGFDSVTGTCFSIMSKSINFFKNDVMLLA